MVDEGGKLGGGFMRSASVNELFSRRSFLSGLIRYPTVAGHLGGTQKRKVENSWQHLCLSGVQEDQSEEQKLVLLEKHLNRCADARKFGDWKRVLRESEAAIAVGADFSPQVVFKFLIFPWSMLEM